MKYVFDFVQYGYGRTVVEKFTITNFAESKQLAQNKALMMAKRYLRSDFDPKRLEITIKALEETK